MALLTSSWILDLIILIGSAVPLIYLFYLRKFQYWSQRNIPHTKPVFFYGDMKGVNTQKSLGQRLSEIHEEAGDNKVYGFWSFTNPTLLLKDTQVLKQILVKDFRNFHDLGIDADFGTNPLAEHLFFLRGEAWKNVRSKLSPTFTSGKMKIMFPTMKDCGEELVKYLQKPAEDSSVLDVREILQKFTLNIIASCAFGIQVNALENSNDEFLKMGEPIFKPNFVQSIRNLMLFTMPYLAVKLKIQIFPKSTTKFFTKLVNDTLDYRKNNNITRRDFLQLLLELKHNGFVKDAEYDEGDLKQDASVQMTNQQLVASAFVFFIAGFESTAGAMQFALYELSLNQDVQTKLRSEIKRVLALHKQELTYECIQDMQYLEQVIQETLRKHPPAPVSFRECANQYKIPDTDVVLEKGTLLMFSILGIHMDKKNYPNPNKFDPDRFLPEEKAKRDNFAYMPFGEGPRMCIGNRFALMQMKVGLVSLIHNFKFDVTHETQIPLKIDPKTFLTGVSGKIKLKISKI